MNIVSTVISKIRQKRKISKLKSAFEIIEAAGYSVCNIQQRAGTNYLVDGNGGWHKIGKRA